MLLKSFISRNVPHIGQVRMAKTIKLNPKQIITMDLIILNNKSKLSENISNR